MPASIVRSRGSETTGGKLDKVGPVATGSEVGGAGPKDSDKGSGVADEKGDDTGPDPKSPPRSCLR